MNDAATVLSQQAFSRLRWRCRRGLLENELIIHHWLDAHTHGITVQQADALNTLLDLSDNDLLDLLLRRREPEGELLRDDVIEVLGMMRSPQFSVEQEDQGPFRARVVETSPATPPTRHSRNDHDSV